MSDLFSIYEDSLNIVLRNITTIIESMNNLSKEKTETALNDAHSNIKEAERILKQMDLEISADKNINSHLLAVKYRNYKAEYDIVRRRFLKIQENYISRKSQEALLIEGSFDQDPRFAQKQNLLDHEEMSWESHKNLESGKRKAKEAEKISFDIMLNLDRQTGHIKSIRDNVFGMNSQITRSDNLLRGMLARENRNKLYISIFSLSLIIAFISYLFIFKF